MDERLAALLRRRKEQVDDHEEDSYELVDFEPPSTKVCSVDIDEDEPVNHSIPLDYCPANLQTERKELDYNPNHEELDTETQARYNDNDVDERVNSTFFEESTQFEIEVPDVVANDTSATVRDSYRSESEVTEWEYGQSHGKVEFSYESTMDQPVFRSPSPISDHKQEKRDEEGWSKKSNEMLAVDVNSNRTVPIKIVGVGAASSDRDWRQGLMSVNKPSKNTNSDGPLNVDEFQSNQDVKRRQEKGQAAQCTVFSLILPPRCAEPKLSAST
eukprot:766706-Hanusia_phi.AAC.1